MGKDVEHLQQPGGARGELRPREEGQPLKIAETILKRRHADIKEKAERARGLRRIKKARKRALQVNRVKSAQFFVKKALMEMKDSRRVRVQRNRKPKQQRSPKHRIYCVVRNDRKGGCGETKKALKALGLTRPYSCTLIPNDEHATTVLRKVSPFVFYGFPEPNTIRRLFLTRARMRLGGGPPAPLSDNQMVETAFGSLGLLCLEDLIHEVTSCGPHFSQIIKQIKSFQLSSLRAVEGLEAKRMEYGFIGHKINFKVTQLT